MFPPVWKTDADGGTQFITIDPFRNSSTRDDRSPSGTHSSNGRQNLNALAERFHEALRPQQLSELAAALGVTGASLESLGIGWASTDDLRLLKASGAGWQESPPEGAYTFPERDGGGRLIGFSLRAVDGRKGGPSGEIGAKRGLIVPADLHENRDVVLVVEGATDVAACVVLGLSAIGRPSNAGGAEPVANLAKNRPLLVVGENDAKSTGQWPGRDGVERVATLVAMSRRSAVQRTLPPQYSKDVRAWLAARVQAGLDLTDR
jgi:hypothetical protein